MSITPEALRLMQAKGLSIQDAIEIAEALTPPRSAGAERQARYRQRKKAKRNGSDVTRNVTPPNEYISNPPVPPTLANAKDSPPFAERFVKSWNAHGTLRTARKLTGQRLAKLKRREGEFGEKVLFEAVGKLAKSPFHCGENDRDWQADIGWFVRSEENVTKALELEGKPKSCANSTDPLVAKILAREGSIATKEVM